MESIIFIIGVLMCFWVGIKAYHNEEQNKVFCKFDMRLKDVTKYNHFCGSLVMGFGAVAGATMIAASMIESTWGKLIVLLIIPESIILMKIYRKGEEQMLEESKKQ